MPKRVRVRLDDIADLANLSWAFWRAARGKRHRRDVREFAANIDRELARLGHEIRHRSVTLGRFRRFVIHDPKRRTIHAPVFRERVLHHALIRYVGPILDRTLVDDTYACREGRGAHAAIRRAQQHVRRFPWYVKIDVRRYFDSVRHDLLFRQLERRIRGGGLELCRRVVTSYEESSGRGLPIGALCSQHFANAFLAPLDRYLLEHIGVRGMGRYMDDVVWWHETKGECLESRRDVAAFLGKELDLGLKHAVVQRSSRGLAFCGVRVSRDAVRLSRRRRRRYIDGRSRWERAWRRGEIDSSQLQRGYDSVLAITAHTDSTAWRREELRRRPAVDA